MKRMGMVIGIKPDRIAEYKRTHAAVWPEVLARISDSNIRNYTIFLREPENLLFAYWEYHGEDWAADAKKMAADARTQDWWAIHDPMQAPLASSQGGRMVGDGGRSVSSRLRRARDWPPELCWPRRFTRPVMLTIRLFSFSRSRPG